MRRCISSYTTRCCASMLACFELCRSRFGVSLLFFAWFDASNRVSDERAEHFSTVPTTIQSDNAMNAEVFFACSDASNSATNPTEVAIQKRARRGHSHAAQVPRRCRDTAPPASACAQPPLPRCPSMVAGPPAFINSVCVPRAPPLRACVGIPPPFFPPGASSVIAPLKSVRSVCGMPALNHRYRGAHEICPSLFIAMLRSSRILQLDA